MNKDLLFIDLKRDEKKQGFSHFAILDIDRTGNYPLLELINRDGEIRKELYKNIQEKYRVKSKEFSIIQV